MPAPDDVDRIVREAVEKSPTVTEESLSPRDRERLSHLADREGLTLSEYLSRVVTPERLEADKEAEEIALAARLRN